MNGYDYFWYCLRRRMADELGEILIRMQAEMFSRKNTGETVEIKTDGKENL